MNEFNKTTGLTTGLVTVSDGTTIPVAITKSTSSNAKEAADELYETFTCDHDPIMNDILANLYINMGSIFGFSRHLPEITNVLFHDPATIVFWGDGTKTVVQCRKEQGDTYSKEAGLALAICKKAYGNTGAFNKIFTKWIGRE